MNTQRQHSHFRGKARVDQRLEVSFCPMDSDSDEMIATTTRNIGMGGVFVAYDSPLPIGTELYLELSLPTAAEPLEMVAEVRWLVPPGDEHGETGMGLEFLDLSVEALLALKTFMDSLTGVGVDD